MCSIKGKRFDSILKIQTALDNKFKEIGRVGSGSFDNRCESEFFELRFFKKGTLHLYFKEEYLWKEFNIRAAKAKNWLPHDYDKSEL
jgi:hypothetical protein